MLFSEGVNMFSADLISPEDVRRIALRDSTITDFDISGFRFIHINPVEFKLVATRVNKISEYISEEDYRPLKILNKF